MYIYMYTYAYVLNYLHLVPTARRLRGRNARQNTFVETNGDKPKVPGRANLETLSPLEQQMWDI